MFYSFDPLEVVDDVDGGNDGRGFGNYFRVSSSLMNFITHTLRPESVHQEVQYYANIRLFILMQGSPTR